MKNADMPASPINPDPQVGEWAHGLTKLEMFAMHAPECPAWFESAWTDENITNEGFFCNSEHWCEFTDTMTLNGRMALMKAWRYAYAETMTN